MNATSVPDFTTSRMQVVHWSGPLSNRLTRATVLSAMPSLLTDDVTRDLPPSFALTGDLDAWVAARSAESDVYLIYANDRLIGLLVLFVATKPADHAVVHLGYLFTQSAWGQGYATELLQGLIATATPPITFIAGVAAQNPASMHVLRKTGFRQLPRQAGDEMLSFSRVIAG